MVETQTVHKAFRFELDPNSAQRVLLAKSVGASRFVYNWGLSESHRVYALTGKRPRLSELKARLVDLKKGECPWLYEVSAHIGQQALVDLDRAFDRCLRGVSGEARESGLPRFKRKGERDSARLYELTLEERHIRLNRQLARKQKGSRNRDKAKLYRARVHYKISCRRNDLLHQLSSSLAKAKPVIVLEDLHVGAMQKNRSRARSLGDAGLREMRRQLAYKADWYGAHIIIADRFFPSTQLCSRCGCLNERVKGFEGLKKRTFDCSACGFSLDRDENAALNLRAYGCRQLGIVPLPEGLREVTPVGEDGSGSTSQRRVKPASLKQEASITRRRTRPDTQTRAKTLAGAATNGI